MERSKPKILFTFVQAGMGHIAPMEGICAEFEKKYGDKCEIVKSFVFEESEFPEVRKMAAIQSGHTKKMANDFLYRKAEAFTYAFSSRFMLFVLDRFYGKGRRSFFKDAKKVDPDLVVSSYYLPAHLYRQANDKGLTHALLATYSPDQIYPAWDRKCDLFLVNNDAAKRTVEKGRTYGKVLQIPFIYRKEVAENKRDKEQARRAVGIKENRFTVLFTDGAYGDSRSEKFVSAIMRCGKKINFIIVCGKNKRLFDDLSELAKGKNDGVDCYFVGFTDMISDYMLAADIIIGKAGSNTVMESLYLACPMIVNAECNRLEELITRRMLKDGLVMREHDPEKAVKMIEKFVDDDGELKKMKKKFIPFHDASGAEKAADEIFALLKTRFPDL